MLRVAQECFSGRNERVQAVTLIMPACVRIARPERQDERLVAVLEHREKRRVSSRRRNNPRLACRELGQLGPLTRLDPGGALIEMCCAFGSGALVFIVSQETWSV